MDLDAVASAIITLFEAAPSGTHNSLYTAIPAKLFHTEAPEKTAYPYCVFYILSDDPEWQWGKNMEHVHIQFSVFSAAGRSAKEISDITEKLWQLFDEASLSVTGQRVVWMRRQVHRGITRDDDGVWMSVTDYELYVEEA